MKIRKQVAIDAEDGDGEKVEDIVQLERGALRPEELGLTLTEAKAILRGMQQSLITEQVAVAEEGYVLIGSSSFWGPERIGTKAEAIAQGEKVGATIVMMKSTYKDTLTGTVPFTVPNAPQVATVNTTGTVNSYGNSANYNSTSTVTVPGGSTTYNLPYAVSRSNFVASFWAARDTSKIRLGINAAPLPDDVRNRLQRNTGLLVAVIVRGTPAFRANILEGDILLKMNAEDIVDVKDLSDQVKRLAGQSVEFNIIRGTEPLTIRLTLGN